MSNPLDNTLNSIPPEKLAEMRRHTEDELDKLKASGSIHVEAANRFQAGLDKITDVLLILVMKFGRATTVLLIVGGLNIVLLVALIISLVNILSLRSEARDLLDRQEEFARSQKRLERTTNDTQEKVDTTSKRIEETQHKVDTAVESAPKVEVDSRTGKAKLVVPVESKKPIKVAPPPASKPLPAASGAVAPKYEIPLQ
jgi:cell division protein FtsL